MLSSCFDRTNKNVERRFIFNSSSSKNNKEPCLPCVCDCFPHLYQTTCIDMHIIPHQLKAERVSCISCRGFAGACFCFLPLVLSKQIDAILNSFKVGFNVSRRLGNLIKKRGKSNVFRQFTLRLPPTLTTSLHF
jgi:hypothetical protein